MKSMQPWILIFLAVAGVTYFIGRADGQSGVLNTDLDHQTAAALLLKAKYQARDDRTAIEVAAIERKRVAGSVQRVTDTHEVDSLRLKALSLEQQLAGSLSITDSFPLLKQLVIRQDSLIGKLMGIVASLRQDSAYQFAELTRYKALADSASPMIASLTQALEAENKVRDCRIGPRFLAIGCPSRKTLVLIGILSTGTAFVVGREGTH